MKIILYLKNAKLLISIYYLFIGIPYANRRNHHKFSNEMNGPTKAWSHSADDEVSRDHGPILIQPAFKKQDKSIYPNENFHDNDSTYVAERLEPDGPQVMALIMEPSETKSKDGNSTKDNIVKKLTYKSLGGIRLKKPIRLQMWLDIDRETFGSRTNPQCVHWSTLKG